MLKTVQSRTELKLRHFLPKEKEDFFVTFSMIPIYNVENELTHWVSMQKDVSEERSKKRKEQLNRAYSKQQGFKTVFLYNVP
jgi:hypothetical protein